MNVTDQLEATHVKSEPWILKHLPSRLLQWPSGEVKPLQMVQNATVHLVSDEHMSLLLIDLHLLSMAAQIKFKSLMVAYRATSRSAQSF